jgi:hypothetical protein
MPNQAVEKPHVRPSFVADIVTDDRRLVAAKVKRKPD